MRIAVIAREGHRGGASFLRRVAEARGRDVVAAVVAAGLEEEGRTESFRGRLERLLALWLVLEPGGFLRHIVCRARRAAARSVGLHGLRTDPLCDTARRFGIPVIRSRELDSPEFLKTLGSFSPDVIVDLSGTELRGGLLALSRRGVVRVHPAPLPQFDGPFASFRAHAHRPPAYGITVHFAGRKGGPGPVVARKSVDIDPRSSYPRVREALAREAPAVMLEALARLEAPDFVPEQGGLSDSGVPCPFPSLPEARAYRAALGKRRRLKARRGEA